MLATIEKRTRERLSPKSLHRAAEKPRGGGDGGVVVSPLRSLAVASVLGDSFDGGGDHKHESGGQASLEFRDRAMAEVSSMLSEIVVRQKSPSPDKLLRRH